MTTVGNGPPPWFDRKGRRHLFGTVAQGYDDARPGYPARVAELLRDVCGLGPGTVALEIGPGTGQATVTLLDAGASVTAVELEDELATMVAGKFAGRDLEVIVGPFETVPLPAGPVDLVIAATSFHWLDESVALARCADVLRLRGWLALWWNHYGDPDVPDDLHWAVSSALRRLAPSQIDEVDARPTASYGLDVPARLADLERSGRYGEVHHEIIRWTIQQDATQVRALFATFSPFLALPVDERTAVLDEIERVVADDLGGSIERTYLTPIYLAQRTV